MPFILIVRHNKFWFWNLQIVSIVNVTKNKIKRKSFIRNVSRLSILFAKRSIYDKNKQAFYGQLTESQKFDEGNLCNAGSEEEKKANEIDLL